MKMTATAPAEAAPASSRPRRRRSRWFRRETRWAYAFLSPWIIGFLAFIAGPMIWSLIMSFQRYDVLTPARWVGTENYERLLADGQAHRAFWNTFIFTIVHVPLHVVIALALALLLNRVSGRSAGIFRTIFYLPAMTPTVAVGILFLLLLNGQTGLINQILRFFGLPGPSWTSDPNWILPGIIIMSLWAIGGSIIILFAALKEVPTDLYEAARLDGAGAWRQFRSVTLPMISGAVFFVVIVNTIAALQLFTEVYTMFYGNKQTTVTASDASLTFVIYLFRQGFQFFDMGYASALAWCLFVIVMIITVVQLRVGRRFVYYEGDDR